jgi:hypothetical protein
MSQKGALLVTRQRFEVGAELVLHVRIPPDGDEEQAIPTRVLRCDTNDADPEGLWPLQLALEFLTARPDVEELLRLGERRHTCVVHLGEVVVELRSGRIVAVTRRDGAAETLGESLVRAGRIDAEALDLARRHATEQRVTLTDALRTRIGVSSASLSAARRTLFAERLAPALGVVGLLNVQLAVLDGELYVLEANPRASRTVPFASKATGVNLVEAACRLAAGQRLADLDLPRGQTPKQICVKAAVLPFARFPGSDPVLGPEMRSTGEVMASAADLPTAFAKAERAATKQEQQAEEPSANEKQEQDDSGSETSESADTAE